MLYKFLVLIFKPFSNQAISSLAPAHLGTSAFIFIPTLKLAYKTDIKMFAVTSK